MKKYNNKIKVSELDIKNFPVSDLKISEDWLDVYEPPKSPKKQPKTYNIK